MQSINNIVIQILDGAYYRIGQSSDIITKALILYTIIQIKSKHIDLSAHHQSLYVDIKQFLDSYIDGVANCDSDYGYDKVDINKIVHAIQATRIENQRIQLYKRAEIELSEQGLTKECRKIKVYHKKSEIQESFSSGILGFVKGVCLISVYNVWTVLATLILIFSFNFIITLPLSKDEIPMFYIEHEQFCDYMLINHLLTFIASIFNLTDITFCRAGTITGFIILISFNLFYICFGGWNAVESIQQFFSLRDE